MVNWVQVPISELEIVGMDRDDFLDLWRNLQLWRPTGLPEGATHYKVIRLAYNMDGINNVNVTVLAETGGPIAQTEVIQGWVDGPALPMDMAPNGGDPRAKPHNGTIMRTNAMGVGVLTWGPGEGHDPMVNEGPHWYWMPWHNDSNVYTDLIYGFGWRWGTQYHHPEPTLQKTTVGSPEPPEPPVDPVDLTAVVGAIKEQTVVLKDGLERIARAIPSVGPAPK